MTDVYLPFTKNELKMFKSLTDDKENALATAIHLTPDFVEYTNNYMALQYQPLAIGYSDMIVEQDLDNRCLAHEAIKYILDNTAKTDTHRSIAVDKGFFTKPVQYPPIANAIAGIENDEPTLINTFSVKYLNKIFDAAKALYDKRNLTTVDIQFNNARNLTCIHFPKTQKGGELTFYLACCLRDTYTTTS